MHIQIPTSVVRNENTFINNEEFLLYSRLCFLFFKNYKNEEIKVDHKKLMGKLSIGDTRTLKNRLLQLHNAGLIRNKIDILPRRSELVILFNDRVIKENKYFTMMNVDIFNHLDKITSHSFRLLFYYKSHINLKQEGVDYCFVGVETLKNRLKMGGHTINQANNNLVENKLIEIKKHKLKHNYEYDEQDELVFDKYNNHYYINKKLF
ncbi:hypothetical protein [Lederbergia lenta]|uniref:hypothetical protein n=1 Tax=Lederbergia lenta TaxID=1467 RepID=UPI00203B5A81|nr:hypothetical protein [Lederbergia lenta]MCM3110007.1 hypothetical protein [Lederbergia lenta]